MERRQRARHLIDRGGLEPSLIVAVIGHLDRLADLQLHQSLPKGEGLCDPVRNLGDVLGGHNRKIHKWEVSRK